MLHPAWKISNGNQRKASTFKTMKTLKINQKINEDCNFTIDEIA